MTSMAKVWLRYGVSMVQVWRKYGKMYGPYMAAIFFQDFGYGNGSPNYGPYMAIYAMDF